MKTKNKFRLDRAAFMTEIGELTQLRTYNGTVLKWHSENPDIASVDDSGAVTAIASGDAVICAESKNGEIAQCTVSIGYHGQNPILPPSWGLFIADGEPHVFEGRMYIYGSRDNLFGMNENGVREYCSSDYHVIYSDDLIHWTDAGVAISIDDFPGELLLSEPTDEEVEEARKKGEIAVSKPIKYLWAPDVFQSPKNKKYYLTFCSGQQHGEYFIAESDDPCGPFENVRRLTLGKERIRGIDPGVLTDDDGRVYVALPKPFRIGELDPEKGYSDILADSVISVQELVESTPDGYYAFEGPSLRKFGGLYYYIYIASRIGERRPVRMKYLISENIKGEWRLGGDIIDTFDYPNAGNVHGSIEKFRSKTYLSYHRPAAGYNTALTREACIEEISIGDDGIILPVTMTSSGVRGAFEKGEKIFAATAVRLSGGRSDVRFCHRCTEINRFQWRIDGNPYAWFDTVGQSNGYRYVNLNECSSVTISVRTSAPGAALLLRNESGGEIIAKLSIPDTKEQWQELTFPTLSKGCTRCELTVELSSAPLTGTVDLDWFRFDGACEF